LISALCRRSCGFNRNENSPLEPFISIRIRAAFPVICSSCHCILPFSSPGKNRSFATGGACSHNWRPGCRSARGPLAAVNHTRIAMRHHYHITIADYRGARHFTVGTGLQRAAVGAGAGLAAVMLAGVLTIVFLSGKIGGLNNSITELTAEKQAIESQREQLARRNSKLSSELADRQQALASLTLGLENIEALVGTVSSPDQPLAVRVDNATRSALEKRLMLRSIPSGFPVVSKTITSGFGTRYHPILKRERKHGGVDLRAQLGTPVYATADGVVKWAGMHHGSGLGNMVEVVHNYGFSTVYGHLSE